MGMQLEIGSVCEGIEYICCWVAAGVRANGLNVPERTTKDLLWGIV